MILIQSENLKNVVVALLEKGGSNAEEADTVASHLVRSNLCGHDSHGVGMMSLYMNKLGEGLLNPNQKPETQGSGAILQCRSYRYRRFQQNGSFSLSETSGIHLF